MHLNPLMGHNEGGIDLKKIAPKATGLLKRALLIPLLLVACGPVSPEEAADRCEARAQRAVGPTGEARIGGEQRKGRRRRRGNDRDR